MSDLEDLWGTYCDCIRPADVGQLDDVRLGEMDDEISLLVSTYIGGAQPIDPAHVARLGLILANLTRVLPSIQPEAAQRYFEMVESVARGTLSAIWMKGRHEC